jgi:putative FmdB family regulatory protein
MPIYEYECQDCGQRFERVQHFTDPPVEVCPACGGLVRRVIQPVGIIFRGPGFYVTDNRQLPAGEAVKELHSGDGEGSKKKEESKTSNHG